MEGQALSIEEVARVQIFNKTKVDKTPLNKLEPNT